MPTHFTVLIRMPTDTPQKTTPGSKPTLIAKPSLSSTRPRPEEDWADSRILSASKMGPLVAPNTKKKPLAPVASAPSAGLGAKLVFALGGIAVVLIGAYLYLRNPDPVSVGNAHPDTVVAVVAPIAPPAPEPLPEQPAQIVNEPPPAAPVTPSAVAPEPSSTSLANALEAGVPPPPAALAKALQANNPPVNLSASQSGAPSASQAASTAQPVATNRAQALVKPPASVAPAKPVAIVPLPVAKIAATTPVAPAPVPAAPAAGAAPMTPAAVAAASDKDVNLLAALVAHNNSNPPKPASDASNSTARPADESAEALLRRCASLEPERQAACRIKACAGTRAAEPVCKPVAHPATTTPAAAPAATPAPAVTPANGAGPLTLPAALPALPALPALQGLAPAQ